MDKRAFWLGWVAANAFGELFGLGATFAAFALVFLRLGEPRGAGAIMGVFLLAVGSGAIEATLVGLAQWWALHPRFPGISRRAWWLATLAGALLAYVLGYLPSTLMDLGAAGAQAPAAEPPQALVLLLAAGLGAAGGAVLSFAQWLVLRKHAGRAGWWLPANMLAWLAGMPLIFAGIDAAQKGQPPTQSILLMAGVLLLAGGLVGAVHGFFLVRLIEPARELLPTVTKSER